tara:strand:+ start:2439 stop:3272 length:834 start_codon:yes stop_codon:yes gene_type:complete
MAQQLTFDPSDEGPSQEQKDAEAQALAQGEKLEAAQAEDRQADWDRTNKENENNELIGGKFKNQEELLKAYQELEKQRSQDSSDDGADETTEEGEEVAETDQQTEETASPLLTKASEEYAKDGQLSEDSIAELSKMDSKDLISAYLDYYSKTQQATDIQQNQVTEIKNIAGGDNEYQEMVEWAGQNLDQVEVDAFNNVTNSGNYEAIKFAVEAMANRYRAAEGYEAPMVSGKSTSTVKPYRSQAELARDIADPRYGTDPAFRQDIEERLQKSPELLQ